MPDPARYPVARLVHSDAVAELDILGPTVRVLTPSAQDTDPCVLIGTIPPGGIAALHSHPDPETFIAVAGEVEGLAVERDRVQWLTIRPGDVFHVPASARHAFRNTGADLAVSYIVTTARLARFFEESAQALANAPPAQAVPRFLEIADRYGHWNATPEENAAVGLAVPARQQASPAAPG